MSEIHEVQCTERESIDTNFICEMQDSMSEETVLFWNESCSVCVQPHSQYIRDKCMSGETVLSWNQRGSVQPHREDIIGVWVYLDCQSILHMFILTEVEASALN